MCFSTSYQLACTRRRLARRSMASMLDFLLCVWFRFGSIALFIICRILCNKGLFFNYLWCNLSGRFPGGLAGSCFVAARLCVRRTLRRLRDVCGQEGFSASEDARENLSLKCYFMSCKAVRTLPKVHLESHLNTNLEFVSCSLVHVEDLLHIFGRILRVI